MANTVPEAWAYAELRYDRRDKESFWRLVAAPCPFCGSAHVHGGGSGRAPALGYRTVPCNGHTYELVLLEEALIVDVGATVRGVRTRTATVRACPFCGRAHRHSVCVGNVPSFVAISRCKDPAKRWWYRILLGGVEG